MGAVAIVPIFRRATMVVTPPLLRARTDAVRLATAKDEEQLILYV